MAFTIPIGILYTKYMLYYVFQLHVFQPSSLIYTFSKSSLNGLRLLIGICIILKLLVTFYSS